MPPKFLDLIYPRSSFLPPSPSLHSSSIVPKPLDEHKTNISEQEISGKHPLADHNLNKKLQQHQRSPLTGVISDALEMETLGKAGTSTANSKCPNEAKASLEKNGVKDNKLGLPVSGKNAINSGISSMYVSIENSVKVMPLPETDMYQTVEAWENDTKQINPPSRHLPPPPTAPSSSKDQGESMELETNTVIENIQGKQTKTAELPQQPAQPSKVKYIELDLYQTIDATKETEKKAQKETSFTTAAPSVPAPNPPAPVIYAEVAVTRGKSLRDRNTLPTPQSNTTAAGGQQTDGLAGRNTDTGGQQTDGLADRNTDTVTDKLQYDKTTGDKEDEECALPPRMTQENSVSSSNSMDTATDNNNTDRKMSTNSTTGNFADNDRKVNTLEENTNQEMTQEGCANNQRPELEEQEEIMAPPVPPETKAKYMTINTTEVKEENIYADCKPMLKPDARQLHSKIKLSSATPPTNRKLSFNPNTSPPTPPHSSTLPQQQSGTKAANFPGKWNTLQQKSRNKENDKGKKHKASIESKASTSLQGGASGMSSRALSMTNLLEPDKKENARHTPPAINKVVGLKSMVGLWKKKTTDSNPSPKKTAESSRGKTNHSHMDGKFPSNTVISSPQLVAHTFTDQDLVYAELTTTARTPQMPTVTKLNPMATPKPLLDSMEFPSISELEDEAKRKLPRPHVGQGLNFPTGTPKSPQLGNKSDVSKDNGETQPYQEDVLYEVMTNIAKSSKKIFTEEQVYETMTASTRPPNMTPTADQEYEVMTSIRPKHCIL